MFDLKKDFDPEFDIPNTEYEERVKKVQQELIKREIDVAFAIGTPFVPGDVQYLSGHDTQCPENCSMSIITPSNVFLCVGPEDYEYAKKMIRYGELVTISELKIPFEEYPNIKFRDLHSLLFSESTKKRKMRIGKLTFDIYIPIFIENIIRNSVKENLEFVDATDILYEMRWIKSENEIKLLKTAFKISSEATKKVLEALKPGVNELELAATADYVYKSMGCNSFCFDQIVNSGERTNTIVARPINKKIKKGEPVAFIINGRYKGYTGHMARTVVAGGMSKEQREYYEKGSHAYKIALKNFKLGLPGKGLDEEATKYYKSVNLDKYKIYSFSHGTGLHESNEGKASTKFADWLIPKNIIMMINVGLYNHPEFFGYTIEDGAIINSRGETEVLTDVPVLV